MILVGKKIENLVILSDKKGLDLVFRSFFFNLIMEYYDRFPMELYYLVRFS